VSLPLRATERLFDRLNATYGRAFMGQFEGMNGSAVMSVWSHELGGYAGSLEPIAWALENLPERAPNVIEFRNLCRKAPQSGGDPPMLAGPPVDPELAKMILAKLREPKEKPGMKDWAHALRKRHDAGEKLNANQIRCYKNALGLHAGGAQL